jgi:hypothetical protein
MVLRALHGRGVCRSTGRQHRLPLGDRGLVDALLFVPRNLPRLN